VKGAATRIRELREQARKSTSEIEAALGMSAMEYFDLESHDGEVHTVPSLAQVQQLARVLGVPSSQLVTGETIESGERLLYPELVARVAEYCQAESIDQDAFEELVGWELTHFFAGEREMLSNYPVDFLRHLCEPLGLAWQRALP
jgi:transcriptional regulator with XRE-family HTH domain